MKINREKLLEMWGLMEKLAQDKCSVKFHYTVLKNKKLIEPEVESLREANSAPENYQEFEKKRMEVCSQYCEKDENGAPEVKDNNFVILPEVRSEFDGKLNDLKESYKEMFDGMEASQKEFQELLSGDVEIDFVRIPMSIIPAELTGQEVNVLFDLIDEDK